jgi:hypothetical protein
MDSSNIVDLSIPPKNLNKGFMVIDSLDKAKEVAVLMIESGIIPDFHLKAKNPVASVIMCLQKGLEVGLSPTQSVQDIANINGRPVVWGDAALALCKAAPDYEYCHETYEEKTETAICEVKRRGEEKVVRIFSIADAKTAGLIDKNIWKLYRKRMLQMRARGFALRDCFPHILKGLHLAEEYVGVKEVEINPIEKTIEINEGLVRFESISKNPLESIKERLERRKEREMNSTLFTDQIITTETHAELMKWIGYKKVPSSVINKWLTKANVVNLSDLTDIQAQAIIEMLISKEENYEQD